MVIKATNGNIRMMRILYLLNHLQKREVNGAAVVNVAGRSSGRALKLQRAGRIF
jgi:hypothetical protein